MHTPRNRHPASNTRCMEVFFPPWQQPDPFSAPPLPAPGWQEFENWLRMTGFLLCMRLALSQARRLSAPLLVLLQTHVLKLADHSGLRESRAWRSGQLPSSSPSCVLLASGLGLHTQTLLSASRFVPWPVWMSALASHVWSLQDLDPLTTLSASQMAPG